MKFKFVFEEIFFFKKYFKHNNINIWELVYELSSISSMVQYCFLGHRVGKEGIKSEPRRIVVVKNVSKAKNVRISVQEITIVNSYTTFAKIAKPLTTNTEKPKFVLILVRINNENNIESHTFTVPSSLETNSNAAGLTSTADDLLCSYTNSFY